MASQPQDDFRIAEQAADWFFSLRDPLRQAEFGAWLRESPRHVEEFLLVTAAYRSLDNVRSEGATDLQAARAALAASVVDLPVEKPRRSVASWRLFTRRGALAAGIAAAGLIGAAAWLLSAGVVGGERYSTNTGEIRSFELQDRSVVHLNTQSRMAVHYSADAREIELRDGEALFKVARDPRRPFRVRTDRATIQAIGTEFNVHRRPQGTTVSVIEGLVRVFGHDDAGGSMDIRAGQEATIAAEGAIVPADVSDPAKAISWLHRRLLFKDDPLSEIAAEFNRYNRTLHIRVEGRAASDKQLTGIFDADDPESLLLFLKDIPDLAIARKDGEAVIKSR